MKLILSTAELLTILSKHLDEKITDVELTDNIIPGKIIDQARNAICRLNYGSTEKILAIKTLRQLSTDYKWLPDGQMMGLADAKFAIEHFSEWLTFIRDTGRLPEVLNSQMR